MPDLGINKKAGSDEDDVEAKPPHPDSKPTDVPLAEEIPPAAVKKPKKRYGPEYPIE